MVSQNKLRIPRRRRQRPRILVCTPEITELPEGMGNAANWIKAKGGGLGDISAGLIRYLHEDERFDLHVVLPKYDAQIRGLGGVGNRELDAIGPTLQRRGVHLVRDSAFSSSPAVYSMTKAHPSRQRALAFQRQIINQLLDDVRPDLVHCNDWMTALVPAAAKARGIRSVFTIHNIFTEFATPHQLDEAGIDVRRYLETLYFERFPGDPEDTWAKNRVDFTASGIFAADVVNTVSETFLEELVRGDHDEVAPPGLLHALREKHQQGAALGILNAPNDNVDPRQSRWAIPYGVDDAAEKKKQNKRRFQESIGLRQDDDAPLFLWPNRLYGQKGVDLLMDVLKSDVAKDMQVAVVANGAPLDEERLGVIALGSEGRVARVEFSEQLSEQGKAAADFLLMPSLYEPCGLPQMEGPRFGTLPVVRETGGLRDTVRPLCLDDSSGTGNGFLFSDYDADAFAGAIVSAQRYYRDTPEKQRGKVVRRVMREAFAKHTLANTAQAYVEVYRRLIDED